MVEEQLFRFKTILEILGKPKEHVETTIKSLVNQIKSLKQFTLKDSYISETQEQDHLFSVFAELELSAKDISSIMGFCFDFMPSSIDIIEPESLSLSSKDISDFLTDLQAKLHQGDMVSKKLNSVNLFLRRNLHSLMRNYVTLALKGGAKDISTLSRLSGIAEKDLKEFLDVLVKEGIVSNTDSRYELKNE